MYVDESERNLGYLQACIFIKILIKINKHKRKFSFSSSNNEKYTCNSNEPHIWNPTELFL